MCAPRRFDKAQDSGSTERRFSEISWPWRSGIPEINGPVREQELRQTSFLSKCYCWIHMYSINAQNFIVHLRNFSLR